MGVHDVSPVQRWAFVAHFERHLQGRRILARRPHALVEIEICFGCSEQAGPAQTVLGFEIGKSI